MQLEFDSAGLFLTDYAACQRDFLQRCAALQKVQPIEHKAWPLTAVKSDQIPVTDAIYIGNPQAAQVLVLISGTHGVEGYCGSAIQRFLLDRMAHNKQDLPADLAILMIHALNPWGMYWARRCDQDGIDLNRNFIDFRHIPELAEDYEQIVECLLMQDVAQRHLGLTKLLQQWGQSHYDSILSGGQYHLAWAPFYGGTKPAQAQQVIDEIEAKWELAQRELIVIDLHSGLGPWGYGELISDHPVHSIGNSYAEKIFGPALAITAQGASFSVPKLGLLDYRWHRIMQQGGCFLTLEFGTYGSESLFETLISEHQYWHSIAQADFNDTSYQQHRQAMLNHFCPLDKLWQESVLFKSSQVFNRIVEFCA